MPVSKTISSSSAGGTLRYLMTGQAHDDTLTDERYIHGNINNLDLDYSGQPNFRYFASQFTVSRHKTNKYIKSHTDKKTQCYHLIFSFSDREFDRTDLETQSIQALELTQDYLKEHLPDTAQWLVVVQADGKSNKLHTHVALNSVNVDGKVLDSNLVTQVGENGIRETFNDYLDRHFEPVTGRKFERVQPQDNLDDIKTPKERDAMANRPTVYDWKDDLKSRIIQAMHDTCNMNEFETKLRDDYGVTITKRKRSTGQTDQNGKKIKRTSFSYSFTDKDDKKRRSVDFRFTKKGQPRGLGKAFIPQAIEEYQRLNQPIDDGSAELSELDSLADEALSANAASSAVAVASSTSPVASSTQKSVTSVMHSKAEQSARSMQQRRRNREAVEMSITPTQSQQEVLHALSMRAETATGVFKASAVQDYKEALSATYHPSVVSSASSEDVQPSVNSSTAQSDKSKDRNDDLTL